MPDANGDPYPWETSGGGDKTPGGATPTPTPHAAPSYKYDKASGLWFDPDTGKAPPQWVQDQLNSSQSNGATAPLLNDLAALGLVPNTMQTYFEQAGSGATDIGPSAWSDQTAASLADTQAQIAAGGGAGGVGGAGNPYAGEANRRADEAAARAARAAAINEAMNAIDLQTVRQKAQLAGAQFAAPTDTGGYFPQLGPNSPIVRSGLADPMRFTPISYNPNISQDQTAKDLQMIRSLAGVK